MKSIRFFLLLPVVFCFPSTGQVVSFYRENMTFQLDSAYLEAKGDLYFRSNSPNPESKTFFFPVDCHGQKIKVDTISVFDVSKNSYIKPAKKNLAGILFTMNFSPNEEKRLKIKYIQEHDGKTTGYILTKIKYWNEPLSQGTYKLIVNYPNYVIDSTTIKPTETTSENGKTVLIWRKSNFTPDKELCIYFHQEGLKD